MLQNKKLLLFDLDETIYDHKFASYCGLKAVSEKFQKWNTTDLVDLENEYFHDLHLTHLNVIDGKITEEESHFKRFQLLAKNHKLNFSDSDIKKMIEIYNEVSKNSRRAIPNAPEVIKTLFSSGFIVGIVTNGKSLGQRNKINICGIQNHIHFAIISEEVGIRKPNSEIFKIALKQANIKNTEAVMIGDSLDSDIQGAQNSGIEPIWVKHRKQLNQFSFNGLTISHISELLN